jgi:hypothetical protein
MRGFFPVRVAQGQNDGVIIVDDLPHALAAWED